MTQNKQKYKSGQKVKFSHIPPVDGNIQVVERDQYNDGPSLVKMKGTIIEYIGNGEYLIESNGDYFEINQSQMH